MKADGFVQDTAEGKKLIVNAVNPLQCGITEVAFQNAGGKRLSYGYYKPAEKASGGGNPNEIGFRRFGEGVKATDPCKDFETFGDFGYLRFT